MNAMKPTRITLLVAIAAIVAAVGWGLVRVVDSWAGRVLPLPWLAAAALWLVAAAVLYWAISSKPRLAREPGAKPMPPLVAARTAAMAMAASRAGAVMCGLYAGIAVGVVPLMVVPSGISTFWAALIASIGALALTVAAMWLERMCRLPINPDDPRHGGGGGATR